MEHSPETCRPIFPRRTPSESLDPILEIKFIPAKSGLRQLADEVARHVKAGTIVGAELLIVKNRNTILHAA
jgi:hypothetical protein